ncbi:MAG TPA: surface lipoprotein assembly modifier, partial [Burkholderiales bacterium]
MHDTNINGGPSTNTIAAVIGGVPVDLTLANDSKPIEETGFTASINAQYLHPLSNRFALLAQGSIAKTNYFGHSDYDNDSLAAAVALLYRKDRFTASLQPNFRLYRQQDDTDTAAYGTILRMTQGLADDLRITGSVGFVHNNVPSNDDRDNSGGLASFGLSKTLSRNI